MVTLSKMESEVVEFLFRNFVQPYNINQIAKELKLSPRGSHKILKKLEKQSVLTSKRMGNAIFYSIDFEEKLAVKMCELLLIKKAPTPFLRVCVEDMQPLKALAECAILFGSVLKKGGAAGDIDVLLVFRTDRFSIVQKTIKEINEILPKPIHQVMQTKKDFLRNLKGDDKIILNIIKEGFVLWGQELLVQMVKRTVIK